MPDAAIAVVSAGTRDLLRNCLRSLQPEHGAGRASVHVVDNLSSDGSPEMVRREFPWAELIEPGENLGYGQAVNLVAARTRTRWIVPSNSDIEVRPGALETLLASGGANARAGAVSPRLVSPDGSDQHSVHAFPTLPLTLAFNLGLQRLSRKLGDRLLLEGYWDPERARAVDWALAAFLLVRREAFDSIGGFDPQQWMYAEDLDLGWRLAREGWLTLHEPAAVVMHVGSATTAAVWGEERRKRYMDATYRWMLRRRGGLRTRAAAVVNCLGSLARFAYFSVRARFGNGRHAWLRDQNRLWFVVHRRGLRPGRVPPEGRE